ncbi:DUF221-domain-containing protein [Aulographum hederae CBS 113979]|uniref:DUF221-domain-containing protein n=1 Tax=Aulographum hederae CBS 113979 TaxID=1176131 RepID=A0A6G1HGS8_9PEZI|nr:DUF221-domain-containing protein [Aulographum hederae CBS 113979]
MDVLHSFLPRDITDDLSSNSGQGQSKQNLSFGSFVGALGTSLVIFGVQILAFIILRGRLPRIYAPRTYLVPERERAKPISSGLFSWIAPLFKTSSSEFINRCGLDAYLFLRYLRMLLKIFVPLAIVILPILLPLNKIGPNVPGISGMDEYGMQNVSPDRTSRLWAHLVLAVGVVIYVCYIFYDELRKYVRLRQAYLTSPQHRLRASATTVLVSNIPMKWNNKDALDALYDVFPGGIRNIWINHNFDELSALVSLRDKFASSLESAETSLVRNAKKAQMKKQAKDNKKSGVKKSRKERKDILKSLNEAGEKDAKDSGISANNPHQIAHTLEEALDSTSSRSTSPEQKEKEKFHIPLVGEGLEAVGQGFNTIGRGFRDLGDTVAGGVARPFGRRRKEQEHNETRREEEEDADPNSPDTFVNPGMGATPKTIDAPTEYRESVETSRSKPRPLPFDGSADAAASKNAFKRALESAQHKSSHHAFPSPQPFRRQEDEFPLSPQNPEDRYSGVGERSDKVAAPTKVESSKEEKEDFKPSTPYDDGYDEEAELKADEEAAWRKFLQPKDRETMRVSVFENTSWWPSLPLIGKKVDTIYYCRWKLAQLNYQIEKLQKSPDDFPTMNSAFIQFNHQVAAHMACQALSHHVPKHMAPRIIEVSPNDVLWDNLSMVWWQRYARTIGVVLVVVASIIFWAIPVSFTGALSQVSQLQETIPWLAWLANMPKAAIAIVQGVGPALLLAILTALYPIFLRFLARFQGHTTGVGSELDVQNYFFAFTFVQVFLVVSVATGITSVIQDLVSDPLSVPQTLASNLPKASNYFFSYMILQALSASAGNLLQIGALAVNYLLAPILDSTARDKWKRQRNLQSIQWGTFFPIYTNFACIGLVYSVISPLILVFNIITFGVFWLAYRYVTLYVLTYTFDTGGLLFPKAINQMFTGLYFMELCLIGLFFVFRNEQDNAAATPQAIIMIVVLLLTVLYQIVLNEAFAPLYRYIPISMEDEAVERDEEFAAMQSKRWQMVDEEQEGDNLQDVLEERERREQQESDNAQAIELRQIEARRKARNSETTVGARDSPNLLSTQSWRTQQQQGEDEPTPLSRESESRRRSTWAERSRDRKASTAGTGGLHGLHGPLPAHIRRKIMEQAKPKVDLEAQLAISNALYGGFSDELEDLTAEERDKLVQKAFLHHALRAPRPCVWIPRDDLGVADDEVRRTAERYEHVWIENSYSALDAKGKVLFKRPPPDFQEIDLIQL